MSGGVGSTPAPPDRARRPRGERGEALLLALFVLLLLGISLALLALSMRIRLEEQQREIRRVRLELLLDGVVAETLGRLAIDPRFSGVAPRRAGAGEGWSEVASIGPVLARVHVSATLGPRSVDGTALVRVVPGPPRVLTWRRGAIRPARVRGAPPSP